jgi:hypothetical protein
VIIRRTTCKGAVLATVFVDIPSPAVIVLRPCFYCEKVEVIAPQKFCCDSHRVSYCKKRLAMYEING